MMTLVCLWKFFNNTMTVHGLCLAAFVLDMITGYIQSGAYSVSSMEERELEIRKQAEDLVQSSLPVHKRIVYNWILFHARRGMVY